MNIESGTTGHDGTRQGQRGGFQVQPLDRQKLIAEWKGEVMTIGNKTRAERIVAARQALADRRAADPAAVANFEARMGRLADARRREQRRLEAMLGQKPDAPILKKPAGISKQEWKAERKRLVALHEAETQTLRDKWRGKEGTPETLEKLNRHGDCLQQMLDNGSIDREQLEYAAEIANVYRSIQSDVALSVASLERASTTTAEGAVV